ncbi:unnamed protein product [Closterium sp. NIES-53]
MPPDPGIEAASLGACESALPGTAPAEAVHTLTLDSDASRCFFHDSTTLTPLPAPVPVRLADPSGGPVLARSSTVLPCSAVPSGSLSGLLLPSFSMNLVSTAALQDAVVTTTTPGGQRLSICTCTRTGHHLATFTRRPGSSLYTLTTKPPQIAVSGQVSASSPVAAPARVASYRTRLSFGTTAWVTPHCHAFVACIPASLFLVFPGLCLPSHPRLPCPAFLASKGGSAPLLTPPRFPRRLLPYRTRLLSHQNLLGHHRLGHPSLPRLRGMHSRLLVSGLPRSLPLLPPSPTPPCLPCVEGRQRAAPHSSSFPLHTLHMDVWCPAHVSGQGRECYFLLVVDDYSRYTTVFPLRSKGEVLGVLIPWIRAVLLQLCEWFREDLPVLRLHSDRGAQPLACVSLPETSPTVRWTGKVGDASVFRFYHPTSRRVLPSQDVTFDESVPFYRLFPYRTAPLPPPPLFLDPGPPPVFPLPPQGPAPSGVSQVDPLPLAEPVKVTVDSGTTRGAASGGAEPAGAEPGGAEFGSAKPEGAEPGGVKPEGAESGGVEPRGAGGPAARGTGAGGTGSGDPRARGTGAGGAGPGGAVAGDPGAGGPAARGTGAGGVGATSPGGAGVTAGTGGVGAGGTGVGDPGAGGAGAGHHGAGGAGAGGVGAGGTGAGGTVQRRPFFVPPPP